MNHLSLAFLVAVIISRPLTPCLAEEGQAGKEIGRDSRFVAYSKGIVIDTQTGLMWAAWDNGTDITWREAKYYCENYRAAGYTDWRMPTAEELRGLYEPDFKKSNSPAEGGDGDYHINKFFKVTCCCTWSSETRDSKAIYFDFPFGEQHWGKQLRSDYRRALPVRSGN
jgi:hypothetical protein